MLTVTNLRYNTKFQILVDDDIASMLNKYEWYSTTSSPITSYFLILTGKGEQHFNIFMRDNNLPSLIDSTVRSEYYIEYFIVKSILGRPPTEFDIFRRIGNDPLD